MPEELVTIARFRDLHEAWLAKGKLTSAGIDAMLADEEIIGLEWPYSNAIGGIRLRVAEEEAESARAVLDDPIPEELKDDQTGEAFRAAHEMQRSFASLRMTPSIGINNKGAPHRRAFRLGN